MKFKYFDTSACVLDHLLLKKMLPDIQDRIDPFVWQFLSVPFGRVVICGFTSILITCSLLCIKLPEPTVKTLPLQYIICLLVTVIFMDSLVFLSIILLLEL